MSTIAAAPRTSVPVRPAADSADARKAEAERWLAALPVRTAIRRSRPGRPFTRLVMYRTGAATPEFWEKTWLVSPPYRMRGYKLPAWYKDVFTRRLPRKGVIVEAGCGNGNLVRMLANEDPGAWGRFSEADPAESARVEGLDFAENAIAENRRIHPEGVYRVGDVRSLPYGDGEISGYLSMGVVEHFNDGERAVILREAARALRPGGVAVITVPSLSLARRARSVFGGFPDESIVERERARADVEHGESPRLDFYQFFFTTREIRRQIEDAGLRVVEIDGYDCRRGWADAFGGGGGGGLLDRLGRLSKRAARLIEQPPRVFRRFCPHMVMLVAVKP